MHHVLPACDMSVCNETPKYHTCSRCLKRWSQYMCMLPHDTRHISFTFPICYKIIQAGWNTLIYMTCQSLSHMRMYVSDSIWAYIEIVHMPWDTPTPVHTHPILQLHPTFITLSKSCSSNTILTSQLNMLKLLRLNSNVTWMLCSF